MSLDGSVSKCRCCGSILNQEDFEEHQRRVKVSAAYPGRSIIVDDTLCTPCLMSETKSTLERSQREVDRNCVTPMDGSYRHDSEDRT